jgi:2,3-bisphosphoglycerate-independent phosphoglycerate mutase
MVKSQSMDIFMLDIKFRCNLHTTNTKVDRVLQRRLPIIASCAIFAAASPLVP